MSNFGTEKNKLIREKLELMKDDFEGVEYFEFQAAPKKDEPLDFSNLEEEIDAFRENSEKEKPRFFYLGVILRDIGHGLDQNNLNFAEYHFENMEQVKKVLSSIVDGETNNILIIQYPDIKVDFQIYGMGEIDTLTFVFNIYDTEHNKAITYICFDINEHGRLENKNFTVDEIFTLMKDAMFDGKLPFEIMNARIINNLPTDGHIKFI